MRRRSVLCAAAAGALACVSENAIVLRGAGATLPAHQYAEWLALYAERAPNVRIDYLPIGSGGGIRQLAERTIDFGATDVELDDVERSLFRRDVLLVPTARVAIGVMYNLDVPRLRLTPALLGGIYTGRIVRWNDELVREQNPTVSLPDQSIAPVFRSDGGGTTGLFSRYLGEHSEHVRERIGVGRAARFHVGVGARGSDGVVDLVASVPGAIGYVEVVHASRANLPVAEIGVEGAFFSPTAEAVLDEGSYPLVSPTYFVIPREWSEIAKGAAMARFGYWVLTEGQQILLDAFTAARGRNGLVDRLLPLSASGAADARAALHAMKSGDVQLLAVD